MNLNKAQEEAVRHKDGPCMVLAPPGSGKTLIITNRIKYMLEHHNIPGKNILVITFTRYAANEMKERFHKLMNGNKANVTFGTFHSVFYGILKCMYGIGSNNLISENESFKLFKEVLNDIYIESVPDVEDEDELVSELMRECGMVKNGLFHLSEFKSKLLTNEEFSEIFREYERRKKKLKKFDFDDILVQCYALFQKKPDILKLWQERFPYILIDEFQDINRVQYEVIRMLSKPLNNLFVVGDDDQSIYGFRGASPGLMLYMKQEYPELRTINLTMNYRSTEYIVGASSRVILHNDARYFKRILSSRKQGENVQVHEFRDEIEESRAIASDISKKLSEGVHPSEISILYRAGIQARMITEILKESRIPFETKEGVPNIYDHFIARDIRCYLKMAMGQRDRNLFLMICNRPLRYISRSCMDKAEMSFEDLRRFYCDKEWMQDIIDQFEVDVRMMQNMTPYAAVQYIRKRIGYDDFLKNYAKEKNIDSKPLFELLYELEERCRPYKTFQEWNQHIEEYSKELQDQENERRKRNLKSSDKVQLMTMHSSKGLEFDHVYIIHANEGEIPYQKAQLKDEIEEERRLFYVAMTRAKSYLNISYIVEKNGSSLKPSRFVEELLGRHI